MVGFLTEGGPTYIVGSLDPVDQHVTFTIDVHAPSALSPPIIESRLVFNGVAGNGTYLTMPSNCVEEGQTTELHLLGQGGLPPFEPVQSEAKASYTTANGAIGCGLVPFKPTINVDPHGGAVDSPEAETVTVGVPFDPTEKIANSYLKTAKVVLPEGMGLNPSSADGLVACTDAQFAKGTDDPIACPAASKIGTVEVQTPSLPADSLTGTVYVGEPKSNNASSGEQFRIFIHAGSDRYAVNVRLEGKVFLDPEHRSDDRCRGRQPAGDVQRLQAPHVRGLEGHADQPADVRSEHDQHDPDAVVRRGQRRFRRAASR